MIIPGEAREKHARIRGLLPRMIVAELLGGLYSDLKACCVIYYLLVTRIYLLMKNVKVWDIAYPDGWEFFQENNYHRCLLCHYRGRIDQPTWNGIREWDFFYAGRHL